MSKHQEYCCGCKYDNPYSIDYLEKCYECELGLREETGEWEPSWYQAESLVLPFFAEN